VNLAALDSSTDGKTCMQPFSPHSLSRHLQLSVSRQQAWRRGWRVVGCIMLKHLRTNNGTGPRKSLVNETDGTRGVFLTGDADQGS
jgi:hypothetical protein